MHHLGAETNTSVRVRGSADLTTEFSSAASVFASAFRNIHTPFGYRDIVIISLLISSNFFGGWEVIFEH